MDDVPEGAADAARRWTAGMVAATLGVVIPVTVLVLALVLGWHPTARP